MPKYLVQWEVDVDDADRPMEAAEEAWACMQQAGSIANCFSVTDKETGDSAYIDLTDPENNNVPEAMYAKYSGSDSADSMQ